MSIVEQHQPARVDLTVPVEYHGATMYVKLARDLDSWAPTALQWDAVLQELHDAAVKFADKSPKAGPESYSGPPPAAGPPKKSVCKICGENGFPDVEIVWPKIFKPGNRPMNPDGTPHEHRRRA